MGKQHAVNRGESWGTGIPHDSPLQLTLSLDESLADRHLTLRDCVGAQVYARGLGRVANLLDVAPSKLTEKLAGLDSAGRPRGLTIDELERYIDKTGDTAPVMYLVAKYLRDPRASQSAALAKLALLADTIPGLLQAAGIGTP